MSTAIVQYKASDGTIWSSEADAHRRDLLDATVRAIEAGIPEPPRESRTRIRVSVRAMANAKRQVVELCRRLYPNEAVFKHDASEIHPMSYAGRFLSEVGGPLNRIWYRFACYDAPWLYDQPYFALNPGAWEKEYAKP